jgi:DNA-binding HxlR family transcriptional regulator
VEYELTDFGRTLEPVLTSLREWGEAFVARPTLDAAAGGEPANTGA